MIGIVDPGGGNRASFGSGIFDYCLEHDISFDCLIGVSAGSANIASFLAKQHGRGLKFYSDYSFRSDYMGVKAFLKSGNYLDLDYIFGPELAGENGEYPLDYDTMMASDGTFLIVATNAETGEPVYFDVHSLEKGDNGPCMASCCVPLASKPVHYQNGYYFDGGLSDPIPFQKAMDCGCDRVVVILTKPRDFYRRKKNDALAAKLLGRYPAIQKALINRAETYNKQLDQAKNLERQGKVIILAPDTIGNMKTLTKDRSAIITLYEKGKKEAERLQTFLRD